MLRRLFVFLSMLVCAHAFAQPTEGGAIPVPLPLFPANNWWNTDISAAPVDTNSASYINFINQPYGSPRPLHPDFGGDAGGGFVYGFPFIVVDGSQPLKTVLFVTSDESDGVDHSTDTSFPFYPIPDEAITTSGWIEDGPPGDVDDRANSDRHMLIVDKTHNWLYELYSVYYDGTNWTAGSGAFFDMNTNNRRTEGWTSADASGMALLPGLVRYDEVYGPNEIGHALRVTLQTSNGYVYPASHVAGSTVGALPMGARLRLKAGIDPASISTDPGVQKIIRAMQKYGLIMADNGSDMYVSGTYDTRWNNDILNPDFGKLTASDFEVIQLGWQPPVTFILTLPSTVGSGDNNGATLTAYDGNYNVAFAYTGTIHFTSTDPSATLPADYTFTGADAGAHTFAGGFTLRTAGGQTVYATDIANAVNTTARNVIVGPPTPTALSAAATTATNVNVTWSASNGAAQYEIVRTPAFASPVTTSATSYSDGSVTGGASYVYKVRAIDASARVSSFSTPDAATTIFFTDDPLIVNTTPIQAVHLTELRQAVNAMRAAAGLSAFTFTGPNPSGLSPATTHLQELRTALADALTPLGLPAVAYTDPDLVAGSTAIKAIHFQELRNAVK